MFAWLVDLTKKREHTEKNIKINSKLWQEYLCATRYICFVIPQNILQAFPKASFFYAMKNVI